MVGRMALTRCRCDGCPRGISTGGRVLNQRSIARVLPDLIGSGGLRIKFRAAADCIAWRIHHARSRIWSRSGIADIRSSWQKIQVPSVARCKSNRPRSVFRDRGVGFVIPRHVECPGLDGSRVKTRRSNDAGEVVAVVRSVWKSDWILVSGPRGSVRF